MSAEAKPIANPAARRARPHLLGLFAGLVLTVGLELRAAKMGVFQIRPLHSLQTSWDGINDTTSLEKTITAVVTATFSMN